ncbi:Insulin-degrading enzyme [Oopsacas minuta]|uniref:Insulin-degrading enzyme n=1 Tax=Oopsacas minuta TaxID=111878 RepID=A0AAV7JSN8_9METZ|nr:Insulin-degrading enzyme [Oopsacas minuta]
MTARNTRYRNVSEDSTDEDIHIEDDTIPLSSQPDEDLSNLNVNTHSKVKSYQLCKVKHREKCAAITFTLLTLGFAIITMTLIYVSAFALRHDHVLDNGGSDPDIQNCIHAHLSNGIILPLLDKKTYLYKQLNNSLRVLVISDPDTKVSGASLSILSGSFNEGPVPGLAHFCEHLLFLGNKKYQLPDAFMTYVAEHNGFTNAYTDLGITNFYFQVESDFFFQALDMFSNLFIHPLFNFEYIQKEINAVNSEYELDKFSDEWRLFRLLQLGSNESHPFHQFNIGNTETLNITNIQSYVSSYFYKYFSSNLMTVVLYGSENITTLSQIAELRFGIVPNLNLFERIYLPPYSSLPTFILAQALEQTNAIILVFQLPSFTKYFNYSPNFILYLLDFPGSIGFISSMRQSGLVDDIHVTTQQLVSSTLLKITILVQSKLIFDQKWFFLVESFFSYIQQIRQLNSNLMEEMFDSWKKVNSFKFDYELNGSQKVSSIVSNLARQMQFIHSTKDLLLPPCSLLFNYTFISTTLLSQIKPSNLLIIMYSNEFNSSDNQGWRNLTMNDQYFDIDFVVYPINSDYVSKWDSVNSSAFVLPDDNFIPSILRVEPSLSEGFNPELSLFGSLVIWHLYNSKFSDPYIKFSCILDTSDKYYNLEHYTALQLFKFIIYTIFPDEMYMYQNFYSLSIPIPNYFNRLSLNFEGYSDNILFESFIDKATDILTNSSFLTNSYAYTIAYNMYSNTLANYFKQSTAVDLVIDNFKLLFFPTAYKIVDIYESLQNITKDKFIHYLYETNTNSFLTCFSFGNVDKSLSLRTGNKIQQEFGSDLMISPVIQQLTHLCQGVNYTFSRNNSNSQDLNSVIDVVYQFGSICGVKKLGDSCNTTQLQSYVLLKLLVSIMSTHFFSILRTEEQLGYLVQNFIWTESDEIFLHFLIESPYNSPDYLEERIDHFLLNFSKTLGSIPLDNWDDIISAYNQTILVEPNSFDTAFESVWSEISTRQYQFSRNSQIKDILNTITATEIISYFHMIFFDAPVPRVNFKLFAHHLHQTTQSINTHDLDYDTINIFKQNLNC